MVKLGNRNRLGFSTRQPLLPHGAEPLSRNDQYTVSSVPSGVKWFWSACNNNNDDNNNNNEKRATLRRCFRLTSVSGSLL